MKIEELKEQFPDLFTEVVQLGVAQAEESFKEKETQFTNQFTAVNTRLEAAEKKNLDLEKKDIERSEKELKASAKEIWLEKLSASKVPERYFDKIRPHVTHDHFVENGVLDEAKFGEAVDAEIADWEGRGITETVMGSGFSEREATDDATVEAKTKLKEQDKKTSGRLLAHVGQTPESK